MFNSAKWTISDSLAVMKFVFETDGDHKVFLCKLPRLNLRARGEHLAIQLSREAAQLLVYAFALST